MKKIILSLSTLLFSVILISSCNDIESKYIAMIPAEGEFVLVASNATIILLENGGGERTAVSFQWDSLVYGVSTPVTFTIQMDTLDGDFSNPIEEIVALNNYQISFSDSILNIICLNNLKLIADYENEIKVRIKAAMAYGNMPVYSNVLNLKITPFAGTKIFSYLYMPGTASGGWENYSNKICSRNNDGIYEGYLKNEKNKNFKFTTDKSFDTGRVIGCVPRDLYKLSEDKTSFWNIWFDVDGYFLIKADLNTMTWSKIAITSFIVTGDFNGWSLTSDPMTYDDIAKEWTANCDISTIGSGIRIIANREMTFSYGDKGFGKDGGELSLGGINIVPTSTGIKKIIMDLSQPERYTYRIE